MATGFGDRPEVELGAPPAPKPVRRPPWTIGRIATDAAIVLIAVPFGADLIEPLHRQACGMTNGFLAFWLGVAILGGRASWIAFKAFNDAAERWLEARSKPDG